MTEIHSARKRGENRPNVRIAFFLCCVTIIGVHLTLAEDAASNKKWIAPQAQAAKNNPIAADANSLATGRKIYAKRCAGCHGNSGNGDGHNAIDLGLHPAKFSDPRMKSESDGELFWKITTGKKPMPDYGTRLSANDRWNVINYIRTFFKGEQ